MDASQDFKSLQDKVQAALVATTKKVNIIASQDVTFRRSLDPEAGEQLDEQRTKLLNLAGALVKTAAGLGHSKTITQAPALEDAEDIDVHWRSIVDALDIALEKADVCIDEYTGLVKRKDVPSVDMGPQSKKHKSGVLDRSLRFANIIKPQKVFEVQPTNNQEGPWRPILTKKPHAVVPLEQSLGSFQDENGETQYDYLICLRLTIPPLSEEDSKLPKQRANRLRRFRDLRHRGSTQDANGNFRYKNPYETEILRMQYPASVYQTREAVPFTPVAKSAAVYVDTFEGVLQMLEELKAAKEIAVDLEHHDFRTYNGLLSLMQVSTRDKDWVVDTLKPWRHQLEILNEVFADPSILKVFHGAYMDIKWLQRDLGLYVVGLFDTFSAADALHYPGKSLAYLLKKFADFEADKRYQMADWRIRPLPEEMLYYARSDTHYLLYVYDMMRNELLKQSVRGDPAKDLIEITVQNSKHTSLSRHEAYTINHETGQGSRGWFNLLNRVPSNFNRQQFSVFRAVYAWRDNLARHEDESPFFIMSQQVVVDIARAMPSNAADLHRLLQTVSHPAKASLGNLLGVIKDAAEKGVDGPSLLDVLKQDSFSATATSMTLRGIIGNTTSVAEEEDIPNAVEMKSKQSQLWGNVPMSTLWEKVAKGSSISNSQPIAIPWSAFVANAPVVTENVSSVAAEPMQLDDADDGGAPVGEVQEAVDTDQEFTLRSARARASAEAVDDGSSSTSSSDSEEEDDSDEAEKAKQRKREEKLRRKEEKRQLKLKRKEERTTRKAEKNALKEAARKSAAASETGKEEDEAKSAEEESEVFDYSKAQSVLHSQRAKDNGGTSKAYSPYAAKTTAEGPKAARRMNHEKAGKSATFKK